ncbi:ABC-F family ATP-binding cassette domain-containing protein [Cohnella zeiphila]|uniref:ABC-F family ATP-binding cassette domain-containing protein n=1 Tax=Cohnella zeiphila TaxID=2761120 RepID=A0A7X0SSJ7_9BACL|nr:ABC-F family ATP-binding cassette domain-containing protein [Cohnella zeiphila]MBB6735331.1 ABC-F family ATP-binding cassette domain-containing protein [Cohnella zeiphila]
MSLLKVENLSHAFADKKLYDNASFELYKGEHMGIVGQNGSGKSTLIRILLGATVPDQGAVKWQSDAKIGHLDQYAEVDGGLTVSEYLHTAFAHLYAIEEKMNRLYEESAASGDEASLLRAAAYQDRLEAEDFYTVDSRIGRIAAGLGLDAIGMDRPVRELSGGQRAKAILAKLLAEKPNVLLLDEPTNFLDQDHAEWLAGFLTAFDGAYIVVSHDFDFLEKISSCICDIEFGTIRKYYGKYSDFLRQKEHLRQDYVRRYEAQQKQIEKTEEYIRRNIAGVNTRIAQGRRKQLDRMERLTPPAFVHPPSIRFREMPISATAVLTVQKLEVGYRSSLLPELNFKIAGGEKLVIAGFNGIGKSTLLNTLVGRLPAMAGSCRFSEQAAVGYYEQELTWENDTLTPMQVISERYPGLNAKEIRRQLALCGVRGDHAAQPVGTLSGGEQSKVKLCRLLLAPCNFLILDEPTNHLDAETKKALQSALARFSGSVLLVSHEEGFYKGWVDRILRLERA